MKKTYSFTIDEQVMEQIRKAAEADGRSVSNYVELLLRKAVESEE